MINQIVTHVLNRFLSLFVCTLAVTTVSAQKLDSIYFNLYTDSLKKGTYNYINVEGRYSDGRYLPLGTKDVKFTASDGKFSGNSLFVDPSFTGEKITVKAVANGDSLLKKEINIYIKKTADPELPTMEEIMKSSPGNGRPGRSGRNRRRA